MMNADRTKYPRIFHKVYWGGSEGVDAEIISNRDRFMKEYKIVDFLAHGRSRKLWERHIKYLEGICLDHTEQYLTRDDQVVFITSPYGSPDSGGFRDAEKFALLIKEGWKPMYPLYNHNASTYYKIVPKTIQDENPDYVAQFVKGFLEDLYGLHEQEREGVTYRVVGDCLEVEQQYMYILFREFMEEFMHLPEIPSKAKFTRLLLKQNHHIQRVQVRWGPKEYFYVEDGEKHRYLMTLYPRNRAWVFQIPLDMVHFVSHDPNQQPV